MHLDAKPAAFHFGRRRERIDWRLLHGVDLDKLVSSMLHLKHTFC